MSASCCARCGATMRTVHLQAITTASPLTTCSTGLDSLLFLLQSLAIAVGPHSRCSTLCYCFIQPRRLFCLAPRLGFPTLLFTAISFDPPRGSVDSASCPTSYRPVAIEIRAMSQTAEMQAKQRVSNFQFVDVLSGVLTSTHSVPFRHVRKRP